MTSNTAPGEGTPAPAAGTMEQEEELDALVARASVPNLGSLFKQAKDLGLIAPTTTYGESA